MEKAKFDLTTNDGNAVAKAFIEGMTMSPTVILVKGGVEIVKKIFSSDATKDQGEMVKQIIEKGRQEGVDEMEIVLNNSKGLSFSGMVEEGEKIELVAGNKEKTTLKIKYK